MTSQAAIALSAEQQKVLELQKEPIRWNAGNPNFEPSPFGYSNSFTSAAWMGNRFHEVKMIGSGIQPSGYVGYSNQFTSALVQPPNPSNYHIQHKDQIGGAINNMIYKPNTGIAGPMKLNSRNSGLTGTGTGNANNAFVKLPRFNTPGIPLVPVYQ